MTTSRQWNPRLIYAGPHGLRREGPDANLPGFDITSYWARSGLLSMTRDAGAPPTWPVGGSGDNATAVGPLFGDRHRALSPRAHRQGIARHDVAARRGRVVRERFHPGGSAPAPSFLRLHDRTNPANAAMNVYRAADGTWFVLIVTPDKLAAVANAIGRTDLLTDPRFSDPAQADREHAAADGDL